ncbi:unnamed protein product [Rhizoctonia solani]|uniref:F-box domain-containing protein n=1 Tax=Rhizoctonia solani TaxID=456999 RepID=A0A8H3AAN3_9AGAM|nr:unnamed protein product [Rhizoctonia solani]
MRAEERRMRIVTRTKLCGSPGVKLQCATPIATGREPFFNGASLPRSCGMASYICVGGVQLSLPTTLSCTSTSMRSLVLPNELLDKALDDLSTHDLASASLVNRKWQARAFQYLYRTVYLSRTLHLEAFCQRIASETTDRIFSVSVRLRGLVLDTEYKPSQHDGRITSQSLSQLEPIIPLLVNLKHLSWELAFLPENLEALRLFQTRCPSLNSVHFRIERWGECYTTPFTRIFNFSNLSHISISSQNLLSGLDSIAPFSRMITSSPNLQTLSLDLFHYDEPKMTYSPTTLITSLGNNLTLPHLRALYFRGAVNVNWEEFFEFYEDDTEDEGDDPYGEGNFRQFLMRHKNLEGVALGKNPNGYDSYYAETICSFLPSVKHLEGPAFICSVILGSPLAGALESLVITDRSLDEDGYSLDELCLGVTALPRLKRLVIEANNWQLPLEASSLKKLIKTTSVLSELDVRTPVDERDAYIDILEHTSYLTKLTIEGSLLDLVPEDTDEARRMAKAKKIEIEEKAPERKGPAVIGVNFGNAYASIAVINNEGEPDCIANEDGERQIAAALSYFGLEEYIGNQAKPQLVKNSQNTIANFRNQLGKKFSEVTQAGPSTSAPIIDHEDQPAYKVTILTPAPPPSVAPTPKATPLPTRPASPVPQEKTLTAHDVSVLFLKSLLQSAEDFLGRPVEGAVLSVNTGWDDAQRAGLKRAAEEAGIKVLQLLDEAAAAALAYTDTPSPEDPSHALKSDDKTTLVLDLGAASLSLTLLSSKQGLYHTLGSAHSSTVGGDSIDDLLLSHFGKEFTKKTKVPVTLPCTTPGTPDQRADAKMRLAVEHTKRTISAGPGAASCAVESLKDGVDFSGTLNRLRFDILVGKVYDSVIDQVKKLLESTGVDATLVDEVILVGGSAALPGLADRLAGLFGDNTAIRSELDPSQVLARGCALQAKLILAAQNDAFTQGVSAPVTSKVLGLVFAGDDSDENWIPLVAAGTPLPARRVVRLSVPAGQIGFEIWEGVDAVDVKKVPVEQDEDDEEEPEEEEIRTRIVKKENAIGGGVVDIKGKGKKGAKLLVQAIVSAEGKVDVSAWEEGSENRTTFTIGA